jgi:alpha-methylacyl-CoA racemase
MGEVPAHPHVHTRGTVVDDDGVVRPAPAPRFGRTPAVLPPRHGATDALTGWGLPEHELDRLRAAGVVGPGNGRGDGQRA